MIRKVRIENFKSIQNLDIELGRFNIFLGESGTGKSNILEAIAMGMAASQDKLDLSFLESQGIRVTEPRFMRSAFENQEVAQEIKIQLEDGKRVAEYRLVSENKTNPKWIDLNNNFRHNTLNHLKEKTLNLATEVNKRKSNKEKKSTEKEVWSLVDQWINEQQRQKKEHNFVIYCPDERGMLKNTPSRSLPNLSIYGEGLLALLDDLAEKEPQKLNTIRQYTEGLNWLEDFYAYPSSKGDPSLKIKDIYVRNPITYFPPHCSPSSFLFLLFYFTIFISRESPTFFGIENMSRSLPPHWLGQLTPLLIKIAEENQKQAIINTHHADWLKCFAWNDSVFKVYKVWRNTEGRTQVQAIKSKKELPRAEAYKDVFLGEKKKV